MLRCIAGFEPIQSGEIRIGGEVVSRPGWMLAAEKRRVGMVFQDYALFPHLTVANNVGFGLRGDHEGSQRRHASPNCWNWWAWRNTPGKFPHQLSGGQQQRVALARALAPRPRLILMDEPFSNLDVELRERLSLEVRDILKREATTALIVTHDQHEAFALADGSASCTRAASSSGTRPTTSTTSRPTASSPISSARARWSPARCINDHQVEIELGVLNGHIPVECDASGCDECVRSCHVDVLLRPDDIIHDDDSLLMAEVENKAFRGAEFLYTLKLPSGQRALSLVPSHHNHAIGERIGIKLAVDHVVAFRQE